MYRDVCVCSDELIEKAMFNDMINRNVIISEYVEDMNIFEKKEKMVDIVSECVLLTQHLSCMTDRYRKHSESCERGSTIGPRSDMEVRLYKLQRDVAFTIDCLLKKLILHQSLHTVLATCKVFSGL